MKPKIAALLILMMGVSLASGCAFNKKAAFNDVKKVVHEHSGPPVLSAKMHWFQGTREDQMIRSSVESLLAKELTVDSAVQLALFNNRWLQATFEELGIARADLVQASFFHNPKFEGHARIPDNDEKVNTEFWVSQDFMSILLTPYRKRVAESEFEATKLRVSDAVIHLMTDVKIAYYEARAAEQILLMRTQVLQAAESSVELARRMYEAGNINAVELETQRCAYEKAKTEWMRSESEAVLAREPLNRLLGLRNNEAKEWRLNEAWLELPGSDPTFETLGEWSIKQRLDYAALHKEAEALKRKLLATKLGIVPSAEAGFNTERDPDGVRVTGPMWQVEVPIFDFKQAEISRIKAELQQFQHRISALEVDILSEVREFTKKMTAARFLAERYRDYVIPTQERLVNHLQKHYNFMLIGAFQLLQAKQEEIEARQSYIEALKQYWMARANLEKSAGGRMPLSSKSQGTQKSSTAPAKPQHIHGGNTYEKMGQ